MPVYTLKEEMPYDELLKWVEFFKRRPVGWRDDQRAYMYLRTQGVKEPAEKIFPTLAMMASIQESEKKADHARPKGKFLEKMLSAKNGDGSGWAPKME